MNNLITLAFFQCCTRHDALVLFSLYSVGTGLLGMRGFLLISNSTNGHALKGMEVYYDSICHNYAKNFHQKIRTAYVLRGLI
jgi:hypothetical protein